MQFRILRALRLVGARQGRREGNAGESIPRTTTDEGLLKSYKARANTLSLVATLIATVTFAAAFSLPGGYKNDGPDEGSASLIKRASLKAFLIADTVSLCSSIIAAFLLIWASTGDQDLLVHTLRFSMELMWLALQSMAVAFVTGVYAVASDSKWLVIVVSLLGCSIPSTVSLVLLSNLIPLPLRWRRSNRAALLKLFMLDFTSMIAFDDLDGKSSFWSTLTRSLFWRGP